MILKNKWYDRAKWFTTILLPATGAAYYGLASVWHFPQPEGVNGTINVIITFLGVVLGLSSRAYNKTVGAPDGDLIVNEVDGEKYLALGVNRSIEDMTSKPEVKLNVVDKTDTDPRLQPPQ